MDTGTDDGADPAIERVRRELALLGRDGASAPAAPAEVTARIGAALRAARPAPAHSIPRPRLRRGQVVVVIVGVIAAVAGVVVGGALLGRQHAPPLSAGPTAERITVSRPAGAIPLSESQIAGLLTVTPNYGPLSDPQRRASCLNGLGYPAPTQVLGARPLDVNGRAGVLLLVPGATAGSVVALLVEPNCSAAHTGLLADTVVRRP
jgi:hypothetical protein